MSGKEPVYNLDVPQCKPFDFPGGPHGVLLIHGFTGSPSHMRMLGEILRDEGFTVKGIRLPGHATTIEDMARADWHQWLQAAEDGVEALKKECRFVSVAGLSMGGCLTLLMAERHPELTACAPISAPMGIKVKGLPLAKLISVFMPRIMWRGGGDEEMHTQQPVLDPYYHMGYPGFPTAKGYDLHKLIIMSRNGLASIHCPITIVQSHADETISEESADVILNGVSSADKRILWLDQVPHACTASRKHTEQIAEAVIPMLRRAENAGQ